MYEMLPMKLAILQDKLVNHFNTKMFNVILST